MNQVPLLCASEIAVRSSVAGASACSCIFNTDKTQREMVHVYLREARRLRPDVKGAQ